MEISTKNTLKQNSISDKTPNRKTSFVKNFLAYYLFAFPLRLLTDQVPTKEMKPLFTYILFFLLKIQPSRFNLQTSFSRLRVFWPREYLNN